jgi:hypothetical protein
MHLMMLRCNHFLRPSSMIDLYSCSMYARTLAKKHVGSKLESPCIIAGDGNGVCGADGGAIATITRIPRL